MRIIDQMVEIIDPIDGDEILKKIERIGRVSYRSEGRITECSARDFVKMLIENGHESVLEHVNISVFFLTNRGVTHELVRHRLVSYTQESTRYVRYRAEEMEFIKPVWWDTHWDEQLQLQFEVGCRFAETAYTKLLKDGASPQQAREVLPNALATRIVVTANLRQWRHILNVRCDKAAHPQIRALMLDLLDQFYSLMPTVFMDIAKEYLK